MTAPPDPPATQGLTPEEVRQVEEQKGAAGGTGPLEPSAPRPHLDVDVESLATIDVARYALTGEIARGGMGRIVGAEDVRLQRPVALKEMLPRPRANTRRFVREAL